MVLTKQQIEEINKKIIDKASIQDHEADDYVEYDDDNNYKDEDDD